ncbi:hypothetical protein [Moraxella bovis]|uniref:Uncharacterized protein n=1 Tax=Moraxella bovis TaxID=476 RepID=A0AAX3EYU0_MORBO|nr:hypothetical protein [Moraxella bovis]UYZ77076.1 hypothetical protein LP093_13855 [Moraxella bovis]UYZ79748.1 hypothetical protein LP115_13910 [Moraxella bovis]UYZ88235.1 hypothetical protein LP094_13945 [Moraxella bovis]UYZ99188.1 hypothetical protein LP107_13905 [Moraxella bovis]UZA01855.1 hypothetical protein LP086_13820 [Moraxella bovis]
MLGFDIIISLNRDKDCIFNLYQFLRNLVKDNFNYLIIIDRLFKKYLNQNETEQAIRILTNIQIINKDKISDDYFNIISKIIRILNKLLDTLIYYKDNGNRIGYIRMIIFNIPYCAIDQMQPLEFYDSLTDEDEPFWMRDVSDFIQK